MNDQEKDAVSEGREEGRATGDYKRLGAAWLARVNKQKAREKEWRDSATASEEAYKGERNKAFPIVYANIETVVPALINTPPVPDVRPRHYAVRREDDVAFFAAQVIERGLSTCVDDGKLKVEMERATQDAFMAGRATIEVIMDGAEGSETITWRAVPWSMLTVGPCLRWEDKPWLAAEDSVSQDALDDMRDETARALRAAEGTTDDKEEVEDGGTCGIVVIWDGGKRERIVMTSAGEILSIEDDPYNLPKFYPFAKPLQPIELTTSNIPVCPTKLYEDQARELANIQVRINALTKALRAVGLVVGGESITELLKSLAEAPDGTLINVADLQGFSQTGTLANAIHWVPLDQIVAALVQLYTSRDATKALIYEISGISDVIRGASDPRETATAQGIKNQWGSLRIKRLQDAVESMGRELFVIAAHLMAKNFTVEGLAKISATPEIPPEVEQFLAAGLDDTRVDVESGSTARADLGAAKEEMNGFITASSAYFQQVFPLGQMMPGAAPALIAIFQQFARYFKLGRQTEDAIDKFAQEVQKSVEAQAQQPPQPSPEEIKAQTEKAKSEAAIQKAQLDGQNNQAKAAADMQAIQAKAATDQMSAKADLEMKAVEIQLERERMDFEREKMLFEREKMGFEREMAARGQVTAERAGALELDKLDKQEKILKATPAKPKGE